MTTQYLDDIDNAEVAAIRAKLTELEQRLVEALEAESAASAEVDACRARKALGDSPDTRSALIRSQRALATATETKLGLEQAAKRVGDGLQLAVARDTRAARSRWSEVAAAERQEVAGDVATTVELLLRHVDELKAEDRRLAERKRDLEALGLEAASMGAGFSVTPARALSDDYRAFRGLIETLDYLASIRRT